jgi:hypothetical protein
VATCCTCLLVVCIVPRAARGFGGAHSTVASIVIASSIDASYLPHARGSSAACEHAFAGEVTPPQASSSARVDVTHSPASPRMARVGQHHRWRSRVDSIFTGLTARRRMLSIRWGWRRVEGISIRRVQRERGSDRRRVTCVERGTASSNNRAMRQELLGKKESPTAYGAIRPT